MARSLAALAAVAASASALVAGTEAAFPYTAGTLYGVFRDPDAGGCKLMTLSPLNGTNATISTVDVCDKASALFPSYSAYDAKQGLIVAIASAPSIYAVDITTGASKTLGDMPEIVQNGTEFLLGLTLLNGNLYLVSQNHVWSFPVSGGKLTDLNVPLSTPEYCQVAGSYFGGTDAGHIYVADENSKTMWVIDLANPSNKVPTVTTGVGNTITLQFGYNVSKGSLIEIAGYQLYATNPTTGKSTKIANVPDGPGYPRVNGIAPDGLSTFIIDFANFFTMEFATGKVSGNLPFTAAPLVVGFPQWVV
jgi:hypothetical protein